MAHRSARLTVHGRALLVERVRSGVASRGVV
ncbi:MAG: leucine zipper domain-containing protein [Pseudonocardia sp.]